MVEGFNLFNNWDRKYLIIYTFYQGRKCIGGRRIMGMYTHCRGWIQIDDIDFDKKRFDDLMSRAMELSERSSQCVASTIFNTGFNFSPYIFIGGEIKNYDNDWNIFIKFLIDKLPIESYKIETKYCEDEHWREFVNVGVSE